MGRYSRKYDSIIQKEGNFRYQGVDRISSNLHVVTDVTTARWRSEVNTISNDIPSGAGYHGGYFQKSRIACVYEEDLPNFNVIKL